MAFEPVLGDAELWLGEMRGLVVRGRRLLLLRTEQGVCAYEDRCAHLGVPLSRGKFERGVITCAVHHYQYDACSGRGLNPRGVALRAFPACVRDARILVDFEATEEERDGLG